MKFKQIICFDNQLFALTEKGGLVLIEFITTGDFKGYKLKILKQII